MSAGPPAAAPARAGAPRGSWGAFFLGLFFPGAGHFRVGELRSAVVIFSLLAFFPLSGTLGCLFAPGLAVFTVPLVVVLYGLRLVTAFHALSRPMLQPRGAGAVVGFVCATLALSVCANLLVRRFLIEPYTLPTASMEPSLKQGDQFFVQKAGPHAHVERGSVVVYRHDGKDLVKRVIGLPGDRVELSQGAVSLNGAALGRRRCDPPAVAWEDDGRPRNSPCWVESADGLSWRVAVDPYPQGDGTWVVPDGQLFVLGDNRAHSADSRFTGMVPRDQVKGRVEVVWASFSSAPPWWRSGRAGARPYER